MYCTTSNYYYCTTVKTKCSVAQYHVSKIGYSMFLMSKIKKIKIIRNN